ncbi:MAG: Na+/H+ antiporter NhaC family protein [Lachnospiraceae bacterium]
MSHGLIALFIILGVIIGAIITRRCVEFMILGALTCSLVLYQADFLTQWAIVFQDVLYAEDSVWLVLVCCLFGSLIALLQASKGTFGFSGLISKICKNEKRTLFTSFILGILIFVDDYLNILSIGVCMKKVYDRNKLPRESLAYMLDSTGAPVCTLLPFSTWAVFFGTLFFEQQSVIDLGYSNAIEAYTHAIPFAFYPIFTLIIIFAFTMGWFPKLGAMKKAFERTETTGKVYSDLSRKFNHDDEGESEQTGNIWDFIIPMVILVAIAVVTNDLLYAVIISLFVCFIVYVPRKIVKLDNFINIIITGFSDMLPTVTLVLMGFMLEAFVSQMGMTEYIIAEITPYLSPALFPAIIFILVAFLTFTTGSNWGMSAVCIPIVFPLASAVGADTILTMAAVMSGGAFGSHACFYSDATLLASASAGIDNIEHAASQLPYVLVASGLSVIAFAVCGFMM